MVTFIPPGVEYDNYNVYEERVAFNTAKTKFETGASERRALWAYPLRTFVLQYAILPEAGAEEVLTFFLARKGGFESFYWIHKEVQYTVTFEEDLLSLARFAYQLYSLGIIRLQEVR